MDIDRGPCLQHHMTSANRALTSPLGSSAQDYVEAIGHREISWISQYAVPKPSNDVFQVSIAQNSPDAHISLLKKYLQIARHILPSDLSLVEPKLWHTDLHGGNLFYHGDKITSIIDWQGASIRPLFLQYRQPRLVDYKGEIITKLPENYKNLDKDEKARIKEQVMSSILVYIYETNTARKNPVLKKALRLEQGPLRRQTVAFAGTSWDGDIITLRQTLIRVERSVFSPLRPIFLLADSQPFS